MATFTRQIISPHLRRVLDENQTRFWKSLQVEMHFSIEKTQVITGIENSSFNGIIRTILPSRIAAQRVDETIAMFKRKKLPFHWIVGEMSRPAHLSDILLDKGFAPVENLAWYKKVLDNMDYQTLLPGSFSVKSVEGPWGMKEWGFVYGEIARIPAASAQKYANLLIRNGDPNLVHFILYSRDRPIAVASLLVTKPFAWIYHCGCINEGNNQEVISTLLQYLGTCAKRALCTRLLVCTSLEKRETLQKCSFEKICELSIYNYEL